ncbi:hypothetical protein ACJJTC_003065 [Scirpophaga incertulas]
MNTKCYKYSALPTDMENYVQYTKMGSVCQIRMRSGCLPKMFVCLPNRLSSSNVSRPVAAKRRRLDLIEELDENISSAASQENEDTSSDLPGTSSVFQKLHPTLALFGHDIKKEKNCELVLKSTLNKIEKKPQFYIGVPKNCYFLIKLIQEHTGIPEQHILLCLKKIRLDSKSLELGDGFGITGSYACRIFRDNVSKIAEVMRPFIANTIKYLISSTANGLVNYVSPGYGGRTTDVCVVHKCDFLKCLPSGSHVMADRSFKHIEPLLLGVGCQLVRPPIVQSGKKLSKEEVKQTKQIASLRIHIEQLIRRLREYSMLKSHACINKYLIGKLDDIVVTACGLVNLQKPLINK